MVLESLFNPFVVKKRPWEMFLAGFVYTIVGLLLSFFVFRDAAGLLTVFLIVIATVPLFYTSIKNEEELDLQFNNENYLLKEHSKVIMFLMFLFLGVTIAMAICYVFLPETMVTAVFGLQQQAINGVNTNIQGKVTHVDLFIKILMNNLKVLFFCIIFSFLYGTGSLFILTWNASVVATAMGNLFKIKLSEGAGLLGFANLANYFHAASFSFFRYMTHGVLEMLAYFVAGLAGGIISIALIKHNLQEDRIFIDSLDLILISLGLLLMASIVEVFVTPMFFA